MWRNGAVVGLIALSAAATGCAGPASDTAESTSATATTRASTEELFVGECGSMTDDRLQSITGISGLTASSSNAVRCRWDATDSGAYAMFTWYRGSPIDRESTVAGQMGREIGVIDADGHPGFTAKGTDFSCEAGVENGDGFLHWSLNYVYSVPPRDSCDVVADLARATVENAK